VGPGINNLVSAIHDGHIKKKFKSLAPLVQILLASKKFWKRRKVITRVTTEIRKIIILQDIFRRLSNLNKGVWRPNFFPNLQLMGQILMPHISLLNKG
jgi:hypothetical protein